MNPNLFRKTIYQHYKKHKRHFPWRKTHDPYRILLSEIMLQQTQTSRVLPKYDPFIKEFSNIKALARAPLKKILAAWRGLGYNRRALSLKRLAGEIARNYTDVPEDPAVLRELPGIGPGTAGAIAAFAFNKPTVFIETNIRRVFIHFFFRGKKNISDAHILKLVEKTLDRKCPREWYWALMDYGAMLGKTADNPNRRSRHYRYQTPFKGSKRELRGKILGLLLERKLLTARAIEEALQQPTAVVATPLQELKQEGFIGKKGRKLFLH